MSVGVTGVSLGVSVGVSVGVAVAVAVGVAVAVSVGVPDGVSVGVAVARVVASRGKSGLVTEGWLKRLKKADHDAILVGYYEPEDQNERKLAQKRYLAPAYRILPQEIRTIMVLLFGEPVDAADRAVTAVQPSSPKNAPVPSVCKP